MLNDSLDKLRQGSVLWMTYISMIYS
jgi:hypothetical protein